MADKRTETNGGRRGLEALKTGVSIVVLVGGLVATYWATKAAQDREIHLLKRDLLHLQGDYTQLSERLFERIRSLETGLRSHVAPDADGVSHPAGMRRLIKDVERRVDELKE